MSEYQYVSFIAVDAAVTKENLKFMHKQSSRAEITPWSFVNEYTFGDFKGDALEMMRRGYDCHLHFADFGIRRILIRLPQGFPDFDAAANYLMEAGLVYYPDENGPGGILEINPNFEPGELEELFDPEDWIETLAELRGELLDGDLRPLYVGHLAVALDNDHDADELQEPPIPAGLQGPSPAQVALAEFYGLSPALMTFAAEESPRQLDRVPIAGNVAKWLPTVSVAQKDAWLTTLILHPETIVADQVMSEFRRCHMMPAWPTAPGNRMIGELRKRAADALSYARSPNKDRIEHDTIATLASMKADPGKYLQVIDALIDERFSGYIRDVGDILTMLREATDGTPQDGLVATYAESLRKKHSKNKQLIGELRKRKFIK